MKQIKKVAIFCAFILCFLWIGTQNVYAGDVQTVEAIGGNTGVTVSGTTDADVLAVAIQIRDSSDTVLTMETFAVSNGTYNASVVWPLQAGTYKVYVADYAGGDWKTKDVIVAATQSGNSNSENAGSGNSNSTSSNTGSTGSGSAGTGGLNQSSDTSVTENSGKKTSSTKKYNSKAGSISDVDSETEMTINNTEEDILPTTETETSSEMKNEQAEEAGIQNSEKESHGFNVWIAIIGIVLIAGVTFVMIYVRRKRSQE